MLDIIEKLTQAFGVSGNEANVRSIIQDEITDKVDEIKVDTLGNLIAIKKGKGNSFKKVMLVAHMDEIGVIATYIDKEGFIRFSNVGGVSPYCSLGQRVAFQNGTMGRIFYERKLESLKDLKLEKMYIDIGAVNKEEAEKIVSIGDTACFCGGFELQNGMVTSKALDDRIGCAILIDVINHFPETENEIYFVFTVQEELGLRGAKTAAFSILPDFALSIDTTDTGDTPECKAMEVKCGNGPAIKIIDKSIICHPEVRKGLQKAADTIGVRVQYEVLEYGGNDAGAIHTTAGGIPSGTLSVPTRYLHSSIETISLKDAEETASIVRELIKGSGLH